MGIPGRTDQRIILGEPAVHPKDQVCPLHQILPAVCQRGAVSRQFRLPAVEKSEDGFCRRRGDIIQKLVVELDAGLKTGTALLPLSLFVCAQDIAGVIPEKVGANTFTWSHNWRR